MEEPQNQKARSRIDALCASGVEAGVYGIISWMKTVYAGVAVRATERKEGN